MAARPRTVPLAVSTATPAPTSRSAHRRAECHRHIRPEPCHQRAEAFAGEIVRIEIGGGRESRRPRFRRRPARNPSARRTSPPRPHASPFASSDDSRSLGIAYARSISRCNSASAARLDLRHVFGRRACGRGNRAGRAPCRGEERPALAACASGKNGLRSAACSQAQPMSKGTPKSLPGSRPARRSGPSPRPPSRCAPGRAAPSPPRDPPRPHRQSPHRRRSSLPRRRIDPAVAGHDGGRIACRAFSRRGARRAMVTPR